MILKWQECLLNYLKHQRHRLSGEKKKKEAEQDKQQEKQSFSSDSSSDTCKLCYVSISFSIKWKLKLHKQPCEVK